MRKPLTSDAARAVGPYSHGVASDPFVFLSGQTPLDPASGELVGVGRWIQRVGAGGDFVFVSKAVSV